MTVVVSSGSTLTVPNGQTVSGATISSGGTIVISSGGTGINTLVSSGGAFVVNSGAAGAIVGGTAINTTVQTGGTALINYNGVEIVSGGTDQNVTLSTGYLDIKAGGTAIQYNAQNGTYVGITGGGTSLNGIINNSLQWVGQNAFGSVKGSGVSLNDIVTNSGRQYVSASGTAINTVLSAGGAQSVTSGGSSVSAILMSGGTTVISSGGIASGAIIQSGGTELISSGGRTFGTTIKSGGTEIATRGGVASGGTLLSGGTIAALSGGTSFGNTFGSGTVGTIAAGGTSLNDTVNSGGTLILANASSVVSGLSITNGAIIDFDDIKYVAGAQATYDALNHTITLNANGQQRTIKVFQGPLQSETLSVAQDTDGSLIVIVCYLAGTMIRTPDGEVAVEDLRIGDMVSVYDWRADREVTRPLSWVGRQKNIFRPGLPDDEAGYPVRVLKNALADGVPHKDLLITPEHCLFFEGRFVPVRMLVNGRSIFYDRSLTSYEFFHIETEEHEVIWADGALSESYLDTGNRRAFTQHGSLATLKGATQSWEKDAAATLCITREAVEPLFHQIAKRAITQSLDDREAPLTLTFDPDLCLVTEKGQVIHKIREKDGRAVFMIPGGITTVRLVSRTSRPADVIGPFVNDRRSLGVLVGEITLFEAKDPHHIETHLGEEELEGWYMKEEATLFRWTNGDAVLPLGPRQTKSVGLLSVQIKAAGPYIDSADVGSYAIRHV